MRKMSARSGLVGEKSSWFHLGPSEAIFSMDRKNKKNVKFRLFSLVGLWALFTQCGALLLSTRGGAIGIFEIVQSLGGGARQHLSVSHAQNQPQVARYLAGGTDLVSFEEVVQTLKKVVSSHPEHCPCPGCTEG